MTVVAEARPRRDGALSGAWPHRVRTMVTIVDATLGAG
jgi:hypothetical protein